MTEGKHLLMICFLMRKQGFNPAHVAQILDSEDELKALAKFWNEVVEIRQRKLGEAKL